MPGDCVTFRPTHPASDAGRAMLSCMAVRGMPRTLDEVTALDRFVDIQVHGLDQVGRGKV
jgi:hypothetical protein